MANLYVLVIITDQHRNYILITIGRYYEIFQYQSVFRHFLHVHLICFIVHYNIVSNRFYVGQYLEELDFLHELCLTALFSNRFVKFAAVLDNHGKLIDHPKEASNIEGLESHL